MTPPALIALPLSALFPAAPAPLLPLHLACTATTLDPLDDAPLAAHILGAELAAQASAWRSAARRRHLLAGRRAALYAAQLTLDDPAAKVTIALLPGGAPVAQTPDGPLPLSITHSGDHALALVGPPGWRIGIDLEVGAGLKPHLARTVCGEQERLLLGLDREDAAQRFELVWTLKEALLKALGVGLVADLKALRLVDLDPLSTTFVAERPLHPEVPWPLPPLWASTARLHGAPVAIAAIPPP